MPSPNALLARTRLPYRNRRRHDEVAQRVPTCFGGPRSITGPPVEHHPRHTWACLVRGVCTLLLVYWTTCLYRRQRCRAHHHHHHHRLHQSLMAPSTPMAATLTAHPLLEPTPKFIWLDLTTYQERLMVLRFWLRSMLYDKQSTRVFNPR